MNYHRFEIQLDVEGPKAESIEPGGQMAGLSPRQPFHVRVHHYCYPTSGVETELGSLPVMKCNRWEPMNPVATRELDNDRDQFFKSDAGKRYLAELAAWQEARDAENAEMDDELASWVTMNVRDGDQVDIVEIRDRIDIVLETLSDDTARLVLTTPYLKQTHGPGTYRIWIMRLTDNTADIDVLRERVAETTVEVI